MTNTTTTLGAHSESAARASKDAAQTHQIRHEGPDRNDHESVLLRTSDITHSGSAAEKPSGHLSRINAELNYTEDALRSIGSHMSSNLDRILSPRPESDSKNGDGHEPNSDLGMIIERVSRINVLIGYITDQAKRLDEI